MRILFLQNRILFPANSGGLIRTMNILKHLARWNEITYLCNAYPGDDEYFPQMRNLGVDLEAVPRSPMPWAGGRFFAAMIGNLFSSLPFNIAKHYDSEVARRASRLIKHHQFDLVICDFLQTALHGAHLPGVPKLLFQHNIEAEILRRHVQTSRGWLRRQYMTLQWKRLVRFEEQIGQLFDTVVTISPVDQAHFEQTYRWPRVARIDTSVDVDYFQPSDGEESHHRILFLGSMDWLPNRDGLLDFVSNTWPLIRQRQPQTTLQIVGRNPPAKILRLGTLPGIEVTGTVPDVRPYIKAASVVVVPLRIGGGTRLKIFEVMAMAKPVVSTAIGCEGLPVVPGRHLLVRDRHEDFATAVCALLESPHQRQALGAAARSLVEKHYRAESVARQFDRICQDTVERHRSARLTVAPATTTTNARVLP